VVPTLDLFATDFVADPHPTLRTLREQAPVHHDERTGLWLVSRYADVRAALTDTGTFHPDNALTAITPISGPAMRVLARAGFGLPPTLANNGTDSHTGLRKLVARYLTPARVADAVPMVRDLVNTRLRGVDGVCDLAATVAYDAPALVLLRMLGIDQVDMPVFKAWCESSLELFWGNPDHDRQLQVAADAAAFHQWLGDRLAAAGDGGDLFSALVRHRAPGDRPLTRKEAVAVCYFLLIAGQETTTQLLCTLLRRAAASPDLWRGMHDGEPGLIEHFVEEVLRREPPVVTWRRVASRPAQLSGVDLPAGAHVLLMLAGTGSDPEVFDYPEQFCPGRDQARRHLAFGYGRHFCLGAGLARMEAAEVLRAVTARLSEVELVDSAPPMLGLLSFRAPLQVLVRA
jgi:cytochrome P450